MSKRLYQQADFRFEGRADQCQLATAEGDTRYRPQAAIHTSVPRLPFAKASQYRDTTFQTLMRKQHKEKAKYWIGNSERPSRFKPRIAGHQELSFVNFQQLRSVREAVRQGFNLTVVAETLHASQPGVSRQIRELEDELGIEIFVRAGKRLTGLTPPGLTVLPIIERLLQEAENLKRAGDDFASQGKGTLTIAATHSQARYALPPVVRDFCATYPEVSLHLHQGSPKQVAEWVLSGEADIGVATEALADYADLVALPSYRWTHRVIVRPDHPLAADAGQGTALTLGRLAQFPIITYEPGYTGRRHIDEAFKRQRLGFNLVLSAMDADVIKTYVDLGMGVGIIAGIAYDEARDTHLLAIDAGHLFESNMTRVALRRGSFLRSYMYDFIQSFASPLSRSFVDRALATPPGTRLEG